jgi:hypothetical protein
MKRAARAAAGALAAALFLPAAQAQTARSEDLQQRMIEQRAVEAVIWGMPAVNYDLMLQEMLSKTDAKVNEVIYWSKPVDWHNQTLTPNPDTIYFMVFFNTKDGPVVIDVPAAEGDQSITANIDDVWQMPLEDAGPNGADKGEGGKYLILPPGYADKAPDGFIVLPSLTYGGYALIRSSLASHSDADIAKSVEYGKRLKVYSLAAAAAHPPETRFTDAADVVFDSTIPYDPRFFESLDRIIQTEPWLQRDRVTIDQLRSIGIEKGKPLAADDKTRKTLTAAIGEAHQWLDDSLETILQPYWEGTHWAVPAVPEMVEAASAGYAKAEIYPVDARAVTYSIGYIGIKRLGAGQFYLLTSKDAKGQPLKGSDTYRLTVPPDAPVASYWSATVYDRATHALIRDMPFASRGSNRSDLQKNPDGSVDLFFAPKAPEGKASNWIPTSPDGVFEILFRLYAPQKPLFDKTWVLPDIARVN